MALRLRQESALNLTLEGSIGSFRVGTGRPGQTSLEVKYFLTHVGLNFATGANDAILSALAPVREVFEYETLDFDEIMQRDIDDARVSADLIPYLLDEKSVDLIKLFPPVVVFVMPTEEGRNKPADKYPAVTEEDLPPEGDREYALHVIRSGQIGREVFQFEQPVTDGVRLTHDLVRFRLNTHRTRLVIVDGQHRAMALLALYRNLKDQWSDERRAPFKEYYSEWTPNYINQFNLSEINLPVILCTVPSLDAGYTGDFNLKKAARAIFLILNKTARKVSNSRNILLDDNDLIADFMRRTLSQIKQKDTRSPHALRIWNVELDQVGDKLKINSDIAITGVMHMYYMIEHMLLDSGNVRGVAPRSGRFDNRVRLSDCLDRLDGRDELGSAVADTIRRDRFSEDAASKLGKRYEERYGSFIIRALETFAPLEKHNRAVLNLQTRVEQHQDRQLGPILFEGQGISRVFETHRKNLHDKLSKGTYRTDVPEIEAIAKRLDATALRVAEVISEFKTERATLCLAQLTEKRAIRDEAGKTHPFVVEWFNGLYDNVFTTVAFQSALVCGFFGEAEKLPKDASPALDRLAAFDEYIGQLNEFFLPRTIAQLKKLIRAFTGEVVGDSVGEWKITQSNQTFRNVVYRGEMQPDQWPKYKYLLMEIWKPGHTALAKAVETERKKCRGEVFSALHNSYLTAYCRENRKLEEQLERAEQTQIFNQAFDAYNGLLRNLGATALNRDEMRTATAMIPATASTEAEEEPESWPEPSAIGTDTPPPDDEPTPA